MLSNLLELLIGTFLTTHSAALDFLVGFFMLSSSTMLWLGSGSNFLVATGRAGLVLRV